MDTTLAIVYMYRKYRGCQGSDPIIIWDQISLYREFRHSTTRIRYLGFKPPRSFTVTFCPNELAILTFNHSPLQTPSFFIMYVAITMPSVLALALAGVPVLFVFLRALLNFTQDPREPPALLTSVPFFEPIFNMIRQKSSFHRNLRCADSRIF